MYNQTKYFPYIMNQSSNLFGILLTTVQDENQIHENNALSEVLIFHMFSLQACHLEKVQLQHSRDLR